MITQTKCFESSLQEMGYLREEATDLLKYAQNYNRHFISRKCQDVIVEARRLMTSEIHDTVKVRRRQLVCFVCLSVCVFVCSLSVCKLKDFLTTH